jgi:hypothetical protein
MGEIGWSFVDEECTGSVVLSMLDDLGMLLVAPSLVVEGRVEQVAQLIR